MRRVLNKPSLEELILRKLEALLLFVEIYEAQLFSEWQFVGEGFEEGEKEYGKQD